MSRVYQCDVCGNVRGRGTISKFYKKGISLSSRTYEEKIKRSFHICDKCVDKIVRIIRREQDEWIVVEDRLPEEGKFVLVTIINDASIKRVTIGYVTMARDDNDVLYGEWFDELYCEIDGVVAWKPLPEPYSKSKAFIKNTAKPFSKGIKDGIKRKPLAVNVKGEETEGGVVFTGELTAEGEDFFKELEQQQKKGARMNKERAKEIINTEVIDTLKSHQQMSACFDYDDDGNAKPNNNYAYYDELLQALDIAIESLDNDWIDVKDRLPDKDGEYLVSFKYGDYVCISGFKTEDCNPTWDNQAEISGWMPLPKNYVRSGEDD